MATATRTRKPADNKGGDDLTQAIEEASIGYRARIIVEGTNTLYFDRYNPEVIAAKEALPRGHEGKKLVDHEAQVYRHPKTGNIAIPGVAFLRSIEEGAKYLPKIPGRSEHSPRPLIIDLVHLAPEDELVDLHIKTWDEIAAERINVSRGAQTMLRPTVLAGWRAAFALDVIQGGFITPQILRSAVEMAGKAKGVGAFRRVHGRFMVIAFDYDWDNI